MVSRYNTTVISERHFMLMLADTDRFPPNIKPTELVYQSEPPWKSPTDQLRDLDSSSRAAPCLRIMWVSASETTGKEKSSREI